MSGAIESKEFRRILGHYPTGVCAVTAVFESIPVGMVVGSFTSVSLDPPLVAFLPDRRSTTWPKIAQSGSFCVNILAQGQQPVCKALTSKSASKFDAISHRRSKRGLPIIDGAVAWIDCELHAIHEAGDHFIAIGAVRDLAVERPDAPLIFARGLYHGLSSLEPITNQEPT